MFFLLFECCFDSPSFGKSISSLQKCDVAPESITIRFSIFLVSLLSHLFDLDFCSLYMLLTSSVSSSSSFSSDCSGVQ